MKSKDEMTAGIIDDIGRIFHVLAEQSRKVEYEAGLTGSQMWVVKLLASTPNMNVSDLARRMYLHPATMVGLLDRLEAKGLVQRIRSDRDRRVVHVGITEKGRDLVNKTPEVAHGLLVKGLEPLNEKKVETISRGLKKIVAILEVKEELPEAVTPK